MIVASILGGPAPPLRAEPGHRSLRADPGSLFDLRRAPHGLLLVGQEPASPARWAARLRVVRDRLAAASRPRLAHVTHLDLSGPLPVLELADPGGSCLRDRLGEPLGVPAALRLGLDLAEALVQLHAAGLLARTLSPQGFVLDEAGRPVLVDIAFATPLATADRREPGEFDSTQPYRAPEQLSGAGARVGAPADLYAVGAILYEALSGHPPFAASGGLSLSRQHLALAPPPLDACVPDRCAGLRALVFKLLQKEPARRYPSARSLRDDLSRCSRLLERGHGIPEFPLGAGSGGVFFRSSTALLGRLPERAQVTEAVQAAAQGAGRTLALVGPAGIGKSTLLSLAGALGDRGLVGSGAVEPVAAAQPLAPLPQALDQLVAKVLGGDAERLSSVRAALSQSPPAGLELLVAACPRLVHLVPAGAAPLAVDSASARSNRRLDALRRVLSVLADSAEGLVLVLDDLQRAAPETLELLGGLIDHRKLPGVTFLLGWRGGEGEADGWWAQLPSSPDRQRVDVAPLTVSAVAELIADTLVLPVDGLEELAQLLLRRSGGNPFDVGACLTRAVRAEGVILDDDARGWLVQRSRLAELEATPHAVDSLAESLGLLPPGIREALQAGACLGARFDASSVADLLDAPLADVLDALDAAEAAGVVGRLEAGAGPEPTAGSFRFVHDRLQEACLGATSARSAAELHDRIALQRLADPATASDPNALIRAVQHLMHGGEPPEGMREQHAGWMLEGAQAARALAGWAAARSFADRGLALLGDSADPETLRSLRLVSLAASSGLSDRARLEELAALVIADAQDPLDAVEAWEILIEDLIAQNRSAAAIDMFRRAGATLGYRLPQRVGKGDVARSLLRAQWALVGWSAERADSLPVLDDPRAEATLRLMLRTTTAAYNASADVYAVLSCDLARLGLQAGASLATAWGLANLAVIQSAALGRHDFGYALGEAARRMFTRFQPHPFAAHECSFWRWSWRR